MTQRDFTPVQERPPKNVLIEWITPSGQLVRGKYCGGAVWMPEGSSTYGYYTPTYWRRTVGEDGRDD